MSGVATVLAEMKEVEVLEPVENGHQLLDRLRQTPVDLVLLDLNMPKLDGLEALKAIRRDFPGLRVLVFTSYDQPKLIHEIRDLGAAGYLLKNAPSVVLKKAVATVAAGGTWFETEKPTPAPDLLDDFMRKYQLTGREVEIIRLVGRGLTTKAIAERLFVSEFTVNTHRRNICRKLAVETPVELLRFAQEHGLVA